MVYWICYFSTKLLSFIFFPVKIYGRENIPREGSFILASNHTSYLDPMILGIVTGRRLSFLARDSLFRIPVLGFILRKLWAFPVKRNSADKNALKESIRRLENGQPLLLFPEGTRHGVQGNKKVEAGVGFIVLKTQVPVIPVFISGSDKILPPGKKFFKRGNVEVTYGEPVEFKEKTDYGVIAYQVMNSVFALEKSSLRSGSPRLKPNSAV